jgi:peptidyl-prolyl cis-trans isomerase D
MLESVRSILSGKTLFILVTLLAIPFVFFGSTSFGTVFTSFGTVNGETISQTDVNLAAANVNQRFQSIFGEDFSIDEIGEERYSESLKQEIINQKILLSAAKDAGLLVSDKQAKKEIIKIENFQTEGKFDETLFQSSVRANGFTPEEYINLVKNSISMDSFLQGISNGNLESKDNLLKFINAFEKTRDLEFIVINFENIKSNQKVLDDEVLTFYQANPLLFLDDERRSIQYIKFNLDSFKDGIEVDENLIRTSYAEYVAEQEVNIQRRASHIMIDPINYSSREEAINQINSIQSELANKTLTFADAVKQFSQDEATVNLDGDLGFSAGFAFPEEFEEKLSNMKLNEISDVIDLGDTLHIITLTEFITPEIKPFEESAIELRADFILGEATERLQAAVAKYEERILAGESFNTLFGGVDTLKLNNLSQNETMLSLNQAFADDSFRASLNTTSFIDSDEEVIFYTVAEIVEPKLLSFEAAKSIALDELINSKAQSEIALLNETITTQGIDNSFDGYQNYKAISLYSSLLPREVTNALFESNLMELNQVKLANGDVYWIRALNESMPSKALINEKEESYKLIVNQIQQQRYSQYLDGLLREGVSVNIKNL